MREIYLVDEIGATFMFNYRSGVMISDLAGLGIIRENTYLKYSDTYTLACRTNPIIQIQATLTFLKGYEGYRDFIDYLRKTRGRLRVFYKADATKYAYVEVVSLSKTELKHGVISSSIVFVRISMWLEKKTCTISVNDSEINKVFPYKYPFTYATSFDGSITVVNLSSTPAPLRIEITGKTNNPMVEIIKDGTVISAMQVSKR